MQSNKNQDIKENSHLMIASMISCLSKQSMVIVMLLKLARMRRLGNGVVKWEFRKSKTIRRQELNFLMKRFNTWTKRVSNGLYGLWQQADKFSFIAMCKRMKSLSSQDNVIQNKMTEEDKIQREMILYTYPVERQKKFSMKYFWKTEFVIKKTQIRRPPKIYNS